MKSFLNLCSLQNCILLLLPVTYISTDIQLETIFITKVSHELQ